ncbi:MAG: EAL domain-containing protein, partial [Ectothiorhodospiraceae bacterium]|nr:EAL domain-containing protein [Ectothiorhodospiraceae bacterium]
PPPPPPPPPPPRPPGGGGSPPPEADLHRALDQGELGVVYQPKLMCATGALAGFEVLVRWNHPVHGVITPDRFILLAEELGVIDTLTEQVMRQALAWLQRSPLPAGLSLSINLSARTLVGLSVADRLERFCTEAGVAPSRVTLELTETAAMEDPVSALDVLTRLRVKGFELSIDDFGTGYSSMSQLARLPFSEMKVDKTFVITAPSSGDSRTIIKSIIDLGHNLGLRVVAEGVEDHETLEYLRRCGCDMVQGFLLSRPLPGERVIEWALARPDQPWLESPSFFSR